MAHYRTAVSVMVIGAALLLTACTTTSQVAGVNFTPPSGAYRLLVIEPDVQVGLLTAGGGVEPREDWSLQARENVLRAVATQQAGRGGETKVAATVADVGHDPAAVTELIRLHQAVGAAVIVHKYLSVQLPTKRNRFDWTLGQSAVQLGQSTGYDYALFLRAEDTFSSGGRVALQMAGFLACAVGVCVAPEGGRQSAYASLVDLRTGEVVWFNTLASSVGDIRTQDGADKMVKALLDKMKPGKG
jgi:hypothetical protein